MWLLTFKVAKMRDSIIYHTIMEDQDEKAKTILNNYKIIMVKVDFYIA